MKTEWIKLIKLVFCICLVCMLVNIFLLPLAAFIVRGAGIVLLICLVPLAYDTVKNILANR